MGLTHEFVSGKAASVDTTKIDGPNWDADHVFTGGALGSLLYRDTGQTNGHSWLADVGAGSYLRAGGVATAPAWSTLTLPNTATAGDLWHASASNTIAGLAAVASGSVLVSAGVATAPAWSGTPTLISSVASVNTGITMKNSSASADAGASVFLDATAQSANAKWRMGTGLPSASGAATNFSIHNVLQGVTALTIEQLGNVGIRVNTFGSSATGVLGIGNSTEPTTSPADMVQLYSVDLSAGNATLGLRTETAVVSEAVTSDRTLSVRINGTTYKMCLKA